MATDDLQQLAYDFAAAFPVAHADFFNGLNPSFSCGDFFFAHAGVKPGTPLDQQSEDDLLWIRQEFLDHEGDFGKIVVHGHTPVKSVEDRGNRINIDTGAYASWMSIRVGDRWGRDTILGYDWMENTSRGPDRNMFMTSRIEKVECNPTLALNNRRNLTSKYCFLVKSLLIRPQSLSNLCCYWRLERNTRHSGTQLAC